MKDKCNNINISLSVSLFFSLACDAVYQGSWVNGRWRQGVAFVLSARLVLFHSCCSCLCGTFILPPRFLSLLVSIWKEPETVHPVLYWSTPG